MYFMIKRDRKKKKTLHAHNTQAPKSRLPDPNISLVFMQNRFCDVNHCRHCN